MTVGEMEEALQTKSTRDLKYLRRGIGVLPTQYIQETGLGAVRRLVEGILEARSRIDNRNEKAATPAATNVRP